jgi:hypothetical protein
MSAISFELNEAVAVPLKDTPSKRLVFVSELLDELQSLKKRVVKLESIRERVFASDVENRRALEEKQNRHNLGRSPEPNTDDLFQPVEETLLPGRERDAQSQLVRTIATSDVYRNTVAADHAAD